ncbi:transcription termination/antitermination protein NusA, partial [Candidatus Peregrinibacteria bacterium]|nr:transcription termination/antitermination protein NusA [Candidatus Peregrinibacteria bacterium]
ANLSNTQNVVVDIDSRTGAPTIFVEKEVVDDVIDPRTEVRLDEALRNDEDAEMGDLVMIDSTTASFGRIAAQTAKQVLLQRVREAEREQLFEDFSGREGELVNGTVQSISGQHITIGLGRTEAILPKSQQVPGERYRAHDKIRVYVLEVRRTNRGPQIFVSRNHRHLLRRLLELEVPEIYNGQVEIKSIAREAGQRSKVAVQALQPGVDPVGACVGMRGVRIQSIVRELNDEKIDVIEWDPDQHQFIAKALSPARVSQVFLEDHPDSGKTAIVIVPDDQLSLAIGREGQNARLAAKLTGWRIDIQSLTESASEALENLHHPAVESDLVGNKDFLEQVNLILEKKAANRPVTSEDYRVLERLVSNILGDVAEARAEEFEALRQTRKAARAQVPPQAWEQSLDVLDLPGRIHNLLLDNNLETVGDVLFNLALGEDETFLSFNGFGEKALDTVKEQAAEYMSSVSLPEAEEAEEEPAEAISDAEAEEAVAEVEAVEEDEVEVAPETAVAAEAEEAEAAEEVEEVIEEEAEEAEEVEEEEEIPAIDDLSRSLLDMEEEEEEEEEEEPQIVVVRKPARSGAQEREEEEKQDKGRRLVFDEDMGEVVIKRKRKRGRRRPEWEEYDLDELDEEL